MTHTQRAILDAIEAGHTTTRAIATYAGLASNSDVPRHLEALAEGGHIALRRTARGVVVETGRDYAAGWDAAARLAGNPNA